MRELKHFSTGEWLRFVPFVHAFKQVRNDIWLSIYKMTRPKGLELFLAETERFRDRPVSLVIAFEQPWFLDWMLRMVRRNLADVAVLVFDNSRRAAARLDIERVCRNRAVPYLALPRNLTRHANRSHGMAMTWIFHNVVRALRPSVFAFLDHDMIPVRNTGFSGMPADQPFYGKLRSSAWGWHLWAGYSLFEFSPVAELPMNFLYDFSRKLDTGGRNWDLLYRKFDRERLRFAPSRYVVVREPMTGMSRSMEFVDNRWLHVGGIGYKDNFRSKAWYYENLRKAMDDGACWEDLCAETTPDHPDTNVPYPPNPSNVKCPDRIRWDHAER